MHKILLPAALIAGFGIAALAPQAASAATNQILFSGKVLNSTCSINVNGSGSNSGSVTLPDVAASAFTAIGSKAGATPFTLSLSGCPTTPASVKVGAQFYSATNADTTTNFGTLLNATGATYATGVDVQLLDSAGNPVTITTAAPQLGDNATASDSAPLTGSTATLSYTAQYYSTSATVGAGLVSTNVNYVINYQ
ncbi:MAG: hypothetical protein BGP10_02175 [Rhodanobacter sp. 68-29]|nr:type 1 fimbrial protein [Rhodanobacter sp.]ODU74797.1 MAG: hypothetical protein ABT17_05980 [Rhodanobacter sp. SCN 69-32]OJY58459.1 MAG: hypothetical protein BGP10_02175 [Rhodanobacter sp. 68-29]